ncbi:MAG: peptidylprolyl isomerase [Lachnospiraceae bacterium]|nr:peptidylprolyl isomerase [Lachnospiraceae bacterium]
MLSGHLRRAAGVLCAALCAVTLTGCSHHVVFTTGFGSREIFTVGNRSGTNVELRVYLTNLQNEYEENLGSSIWNEDANKGAGEALRQNALFRLSRVKILDQYAEKNNLSLSSDDEEKANKAAEQYYGGLSDAEKSYLGVSEKSLLQMYEDYALAEKSYEQMISTVDTEISDDEARTVQIQCITIRTYRINENGKRVEFTDKEKKEAKKKADAIHKEIFDGMKNNTGVTFDTYISRYNEEGSGTYTIGRGEYDEAFENAAFAAETGKIGDVVETKDGYRIIKGISAYDQTQTDANKKKIAKRRQEEAFDKAFNAFAKDLDSEVDQQAFEKITIPPDPKIQTKSFFDTYNQYFVSTQAD